MPLSLARVFHLSVINISPFQVGFAVDGDGCGHDRRPKKPNMAVRITLSTVNRVAASTLRPLSSSGAVRCSRISGWRFGVRGAVAELAASAAAAAVDAIGR